MLALKINVQAEAVSVAGRGRTSGWQTTALAGKPGPFHAGRRGNTASESRV